MHDATRTIRDTLGSVFHARPVPHEVICVDDASSDDSLEAVRAFARDHNACIRIIELSSRSGPAAARNAGAAHARSPLVLFLDSDVALQPGTLERLLARYARQGRGAVVSVYHVRNSAGGILSDFTTLYSSFNYRSSRHGPSHFSSQGALVSREEFLQVGGFDERFRAATVEDIELGFRLREAGIPVSADPEALVIHNSRYTPGRFVRNYVRKGFDFGWVLRQQRTGTVGGGYGSLSDVVSVALLGAIVLAALASMAGLPAWSCGVPAAALVIHWRGFAAYAHTSMGWRRVVPFVMLRAAAMVLSASAGAVGYLWPRGSVARWHSV